MAIVFARGGSKGLPGKNLRPFRGQPLVALAVETARACPSINRVFVSTDDEEIAAAARAAGAEVPFMRPAELATDDVAEWLAWQHAIRALRQLGADFDLLVSVPPTAPLRSVDDIERCVSAAKRGSADMVLTVTPAPHNPWFSMVKLDDSGRARLAVDPESPVWRRQDAPPVFAITPVAYVARPEYVLSSTGIFDGSVEAVVVPRERAVDVDDEFDLRMAIALDRPGPTSAAATAQIGERTVGGTNACFVIAEAGVNHNGDVGLALDLVDAAAATGADAVKFQTFDPEALATNSAPKAEYQMANGPAGEPQIDMLRRLALPAEAWTRLRARAMDREIVFLSSPFDAASLCTLVELGVPAIKLGSGELTNLPLVRRVAKTGLPLILSTGMADLDEVARAVEGFEQAGGRGLVLMHCVSMYPAPAESSNLRAMNTMSERFGVPVGFSDHTSGTAVAVAAVALGAAVVEKHLTLDRSLPGPDHAASLEAADFADMVRHIREVESARGDGTKRPFQGEDAIAQVARKSLVAARDLPVGHVVAPEDVDVRRPGTGISPAKLDVVIGSRIQSNVSAGSVLTWTDFE